MMLIVGFSIYGMPLFYNLWVSEFGWKRADIQLGNTMGKLIAGPLLGFFVGWVIDRKGSRGAMAAGVLFAASGLFCFSFTHGLHWLYGCFLLAALGYLCAGPLPNQVLLSHWFTRYRGRVMGIAYVGIGVGGALVPWVVHLLNAHFHNDWRETMRVLAGLYAVVLFSLLLIIRRRPSDLGLLPDGISADSGATPPEHGSRISLGRIFSTPAFWLLAVGSVMSIGAIGGVIQNLPLFIADIIPKPEIEITKTRIMSLVLFSSIAGRIAMGWLADRFTKKYVMLVTYCIVGFAIPVLLLARSNPQLLYVFAVCFGFGLGADYMLIPLMAAECFGLAALSRVLGIIIMSDSIGEATMPYLIAHIRDASGSYAAGFAILCGLAMIGAVAIASIRYRGGVPVSWLKLQDQNLR